MELRALLSSTLQVSEGDILRYFQTFASHDHLQTFLTPTTFELPPLGTPKTVNLGEITTVKILFLQTDQPVWVTVTFAPTTTPPPTPATQTFLVNQLLYLTTEISSIIVANPNSGMSPDQDAHVALTLVGI